MSKELFLLSKPPLNILINPDAINRKRPWEIDLTELLDAFIKILVESRLPDLKLCGSVALSSSLIYRLKVETLFLFEKLRIESRQDKLLEPPQILMLPFRHEQYTTTFEDLIYAFERTLQEILDRSRKEKPKTTIIEPKTVFEIDPFIANIRKELLDFKKKFLNILESKKEILFNLYVQNKPLLEKVRIFIFLLFIAMEGLIKLEQFNEDIKISLDDLYARK